MKRINKASSVIFLAVVMVMITAIVSSAALLGDVDLSGKITASDARFVLRASVGLETITDEQLKLADADFNGTITAADARLILRASVGLEQLGSAEKEHDLVTEITEATCKNEGLKTVSCKNCDYKIIEVLEKLPHTMGEWEIVADSTAVKEGYERSTCEKCGHYTDRTIPVKETAFYITVNEDVNKSYKVPVAADGKYSLEAPRKPGYEFRGWTDEAGNEFAAEGIVTGESVCSAVWELTDTDSARKLISFAGAGADKIKITADITVTEPIYVPYETVVYSDGDFSIVRSPEYKGDIFVVGSDKYGNKSVDKGIKAVLTLGGGEGMLTIDGNRDNVTVDVNGALVFSADSSELNLYDGARLINNLKISNDRVNKYQAVMSEAARERVGGAAVINITSTFNMYGGLIDNNEIATEFTETDNGDGTVTKTENNACGGALYNRGTFNMYGGVMSNNTALRGGAVYNDRFCYLYSGEISNNFATVYGGALSSSSSSSADTFVGSREVTENQMLIKNNHSLRAGGAMYSNTSSPIVIYSNSVFEGNRSDTSGGAVYTAGPLVVEGAAFTGNTCEYSGGAIYHHYTKAEFKRKYILLDKCIFDSNKAGLGGAVILSASGQIEDEGTYAEITDCTFTKNEGIVTEINPGNGGALYITRNSDAVISKCSFTENAANKNAGAIAIHSGATAKITDVAFDKNKASLGGAVYTSSDSNVTMKNVGFNENAAVMGENLSGGNGGAVYYAKAKLTLDNVDFNNNTAENNAGAIYQNSAQLKLDETCDFIGNKAGNHGGALYLTYSNNEDGTKTGSVLDATNVTFKDNSALSGGALSARSASTLTINNVSFTGNSTPDAKVSTTTGGGAVYSNNSDVKITDTVFDGNSSGYYGGAVRLDSCVTEIKNTQILNSSGGTGGAVYSSGETLEAENLILKGNSSTLNGVMYIVNKNATFRNLEAKENNGVNGGVIYASKKTNIDIIDSELSQNKAKQGGSLFITAESVVNASACEFSDNIAEKGQGGAVYVNGATFNASEGSSFTKNFSQGHGGAISSQDIITEIIPEPDPEIKPEEKPEDTSDDVIEPGSGDTPGDIPEDSSDDFPEEFPEDFTEETTEETTQSVSEGSSESAPVLVNDEPVISEEETEEETSAEETSAEETSAEETSEEETSEEETSEEETSEEETSEEETSEEETSEEETSEEETSEEETTSETSGGTSEPIIQKTYSHLNISNCTFDNNTGSSGGAVYCNDTFYEITDCSFTSNTATNENYGGGAVYNTGSTGKLSKVVFEGNTALNGGAVAVYTNSEVEFSDITAKFNEATANGGVIYANKCKVELTKENIIFTDNKANHGGAVYVSKAPLFDINGAVIERNTALSNGGALYASGCTVNISGKDTVIADNEAAGHGGAIYLSYVTEADSTRTGGILNINETSLTGNKALYGGAVSARSSSTVNLTGLTLSGNSTPDATAENKAGGGAIYTNNSVLSLTDVNVTGNSSGYYGGAVFTDEADVILKNITVTENTGGTGAAFYLSGGSSLEAEDAAVENNTSSANGIFYFSGKTFNLKGLTAKNNYARLSGGVIYTSGSAAVNITESVFEENTASAGGAVYCRSSEELTVTDTVFRKNSANNGGAVNIVGAPVVMTGENEFTENTATGHGGAVYVTYIAADADAGTEARLGSLSVTEGKFEKNTAVAGGAISVRSDCEAIFTDTVFTENTVKGYEIKSDGKGEPDGNAEGGGAVYVGYGKLTLNNVTAVDNTAEEYINEEDNSVIKSFGGAVAAVKSEISVENGSYENNKASTGGAFNIIDNSSVTVKGTAFENNESVYVNTDFDNTVGGGALNVKGGTLTLEAVKLNGNKSGYYGGALMANGVTADILGNSEIKDNEGSTGSAMNFRNRSQVTVTDTLISNNKADINGVIYANNSTLTFDKITATDNEAGNGGVIFASNANTVINVKNSSLYGNTASSKGGAVYTENAALTFENSTLYENSAVSGGAVYTNAGKAQFNGGSISKHTASSGGAVCAVENAQLSIDSAEFTENTASKGGAVYTSKSVLTISGSDLSDNAADSNGGALYLVASDVTLTGANSFSGNTAVNHGGAAYVVYLDVTEEDGTEKRIPCVVNVTGGEFSENTAVGGGAFSIRSACEATFTDTVFTKNSVKGYEIKADGTGEADGNAEGGGAVYVGFGSLTLNNITADGNIAAEDVDSADNTVIKSFGGAVAAVASDVTVTGGLFTGNSASSGGAFHLISKSDLSISGAALENNVSVYDNTDYNNDFGGGAINADGGSVTIDNTALKGNKTDYYGGAVLLGDVTAEIKGNTVIENSEGGTGSALYFKEGCEVTVNGLVLKNNTATNNGTVYANNTVLDITGLDAGGNKSANGGVIYVSNKNSVITVKDSTMSENTATSAGGAFYSLNASVTFTDSFIENNEAKKGGAVYSEAAKTVFENTSVSQNTAKGNGGAVFAVGGEVNFTGGNVSENTAVSGGAVFMDEASTSVIKNTAFSENTSTSAGGAINAFKSDITIENASFSSNVSGSNAGGLYLKQTKLSFTGTRFENNSANGSGGALELLGSEATASGDNIFSGNTATLHGGAVYVVYADITEGENADKVRIPSVLTMENGEFTGNSGLGGGAVSIRSACEAAFTGTEFTGNSVKGYDEKGEPDGNSEGGGAIYVGFGKLTLNNVTADGNTAEEDVKAEDNSVIKSFGGAVTSVDSTVTVTGGVFRNNSASAGGAFNLMADTVFTASGAIFENNASVYDNTDYQNKIGGGAIKATSGSLVIENTTFRGSKTDYYGGAVHGMDVTAEIKGDSVVEASEGGTGSALFFNEGSNVTLNGLTLRDNISNANGVIYINNADIDAVDIEATGNNAKKGGVLYISNPKSSAEISGSRFTGNTATDSGAVIYSDSVNITVNESEFISNTAKNGGVVAVSAAELSFADSSASGNKASGSGAVIYSDAANVTVSASEFASNTAKNGAVLYALDADVSIASSSATGNTSTSSGGAVYIAGCTTDITDTVFAGNSTNNHGGAVYLSGGTLTAGGNTVFSENSAKNHGGGVYVVYQDVEQPDGTTTRVPSVFTMENGAFTSNTALGGGAVSIRSNCEAAFTKTLFDSNTVTGFADEADGDGESGGAVYVGWGKLSFTDVTAKNNTAAESTGTEENPVNYNFGGAVNAYKGEVNITGGSFEANKATAGGAISTIGSTLTVNGASFAANESLGNADTALIPLDSNLGGGAIYADGGEVIMTASVLDGNKTNYYGGAVHSSGADVTVNGNSVISNTSGTTGAALYFKNSSEALLENITITGNTASSNGVVYLNSGTVTMNNVTANKNTASGGAVLYVSGTAAKAVINGGVWSENTATQGGAMVVNQAEASVDGVTFSSNSASLGGAVYVVRGEAAFNNVAFNSNEAVKTDAGTNGNGGAVSVGAGEVTVTGETSFRNNSAEGHGGAVYVSYGNNSDGSRTPGELYMTGGIFEANTAYAGGAVSARTSCISQFTSTEFKNNSATSTSSDGGAGAVYANNNTVTFTGITASGNSTGGYGGFMTAQAADVTVKDSTFSGNTGKTGAVFHFRSKSTGTISGCVFENNIAEDSAGAINITGSGTSVTVSDNTVFRGNTAKTAGAVLLDAGAAMNIASSSFTQNSATSGDGGAVIISDSSEKGTAASSLTMNAVTFDGNTASSKGGAVSTDTSSPNLLITATGCVFNANKALGAGGGAVEIQNGNCTSAEGPEKLNFVFTSCKFTSNTSKTTGGAVEIRTSSCAEFDGIEATNNSAGSSKQNGGVFYITSNHSRLYLTGTVTQSGNTASNGNFAYLYKSSGYSNPPRIYTSHSSSASWVSDLGGNSSCVTYDVTTMP